MEREEPPAMATGLKRIAAKDSGIRCCDQSCFFRTGSYRLSQGCESTFEELSAGNPHATFCGSRRRVTASGDPVGAGKLAFLPRPDPLGETRNG